MRRKFVIIFLITILCMTIPSFDNKVYATVGGSCGSGCTWSFDYQYGLLSIDGTGAMDDYDVYMSPWAQYKDLIKEIKVYPGVSRIGKAAFLDCPNLYYVWISTGTVEIADYAFAECNSLKYLEIYDMDEPYASSASSSSLKRIGKYAFAKCGSLVDFCFPVSLTVIDDFAFSNCTSLKELTIKENLNYLGMGVFMDCSNLKKVVFQNNSLAIGDYCFGECFNLRRVVTLGSIKKSWKTFICWMCILK